MTVKAKINVQDHFLNQVRRERVKIKVVLTNGREIEGLIRSFDNYSCIVESDTEINLVYKHAISVVSPAAPEKLRNLISFNEK